MAILHRNQYAQIWYEEFPITMTGIWANPQKINMKVRYMGSDVRLTFPPFIAPQNTESAAINFALPTALLFPYQQIVGTLMVIDNGIYGPSTGIIIIEPTGKCTISMESNLFSGNGEGGFAGFTVSYDTNPFNFG